MVPVVHGARHRGYFERNHMFNWVTGKKTASTEASNRNPNEVVTGTLLQAVQTLEGGYKTGSYTLVHFVLQVEVAGNATNEFVVVKASPCDFEQAPLLKAGDRVSVTFEGHGEREDVLAISIDFAARATSARAAVAGQGCCG